MIYFSFPSSYNSISVIGNLTLSITNLFYQCFSVFCSSAALLCVRIYLSTCLHIISLGKSLIHDSKSFFVCVKISLVILQKYHTIVMFIAVVHNKEAACGTDYG